MQFFPWQTDYEAYQAEVGRHRAMSYTDYVAERFRLIYEMDKPEWPLGLAAEDLWRQDGKPYYNIHPQLVPKLAKINLDKIPANLLQMPHEFNCVHIRFCQQHEELTFGNDEYDDRNGKMLPSGSFIHGMLMVDFRKGVPFPAYGKRANLPQILFVFDYGGPVLERFLGYFTLYIEGNESLLHVLKRVDPPLDLQRSKDITCANALKLAVTIGFLANSKSELIEYDVLSKFSREFSETKDEDRKQAIIDKSRKRGKVGYNVGNDLMFLGPQPVGGSHGVADERELRYAHIRTGHPHAVRYGTGHSLVKVMWFAPTVVRSDLPFKGEHG
jgi:hypothetical protein